MRRLAIILLTVSLLAACSSKNEPQPEMPAAPKPSVATVVNNPDFPVGYSPDFAYRIRSRKSEPSAEGVTRRLVIEFKEGDSRSIDKQIEASLSALGYKRYKAMVQGIGIYGDYGKHGHRISVTTSPSAGQLILSEGSKGTIYWVWKE